MAEDAPVGGNPNMRGRIYDPTYARFLTADPITQDPTSTQGLNRFAYVFNDPLNYVDPTGFQADDSTWWGLGAVGAAVGGAVAYNAFGTSAASGAAVGGGMAGGATIQIAGGGMSSAAAFQTLGQMGSAATIANNAYSMLKTPPSTMPGVQATNTASPSMTTGSGDATGKHRAGVLGQGRLRGGHAPNATPLRAGDPKGGPGPNLTYDPNAYAYRLSVEARRVLQPVFNNFGFDTQRITIAFGSSPSTGGSAAFTVGDSVIINRDAWRVRTPQQQRELLAHEVTHSVQYSRIGKTRFLARYGPEYLRADNYIVPDQLAEIPLSELNPVDSRFTLDQIAERVAAGVP